MVGADRPLVSTTEIWFSKQLQKIILLKTIDPKQGDSTTRVTNISRLEPDPDLFRIPTDYSVIEEKQWFSMTVTK